MTWDQLACDAGTFSATIQGNPDGRDRYAEYLICQQRGHESSGMTLTSSPPWEVCRFCGTHYRHEVNLVEQNVPEEPQP